MKALAVMLAALTLAAPAQAGEARVIDGDGLEIAEVTYRLWGIDAPEIGQDCERDGTRYPCGEIARDMLRALIGGDPVTCEKVDEDRYGRTVARCAVGGRDLGSMMVNAGWALDFERYSGGHYAFEEDQARQADRGLWAGDFTPPWEWRSR